MMNTNTFEAGQKVLVTEFARPYKRISATIISRRESGWMVKYDTKQNGQKGGWHFADELIPRKAVR
jgi:hypothetical protein